MCKYIGVNINNNGKYSITVSVGKERIYLGQVEDEVLGAKIRDEYIINNSLKCRLNFPPPEPENLIPNTKQILLTGKMYAIVDECDYEYLNQFKWQSAKFKGSNTYYAMRHIVIDGKKTCIRMHREIMGVTDPIIQIDHINRNGLHNYRLNLRICDALRNAWNHSPTQKTSMFKGVYFIESRNKYTSEIMKNGVRYYLGYFDSEIDAAKAYDKKAFELFGEFAYLNFPEDFNIAI